MANPRERLLTNKNYTGFFITNNLYICYNFVHKVNT